MLTVDYPTFKEIVGRVSYDKRPPIYFFEDEKKFVLFFADGIWNYASVVLKDEIKSFVAHSQLDKDYIDFIREFRRRNLDGAVRVIGYDYKINVQESEAKTVKETTIIQEQPTTEQLPFQVKEPDTLVAEINEKIAKEGGL
jgi:hypothetical protein